MWELHYRGVRTRFVRNWTSHNAPGYPTPTERITERIFPKRFNNYKRIRLPPHLHEPIAQLPDDPSAVEVLMANEQQVPVATTTVRPRQYCINRDSLIPIHELVHRLESHGMISNTCSPFNSPIWTVQTSNAIACDHRLHTPMYFFLLNLALLDLGSISTTLPKAMANALCDTRAISYQGCVAQVFLFPFLAGVEFSILTVMAYDRYIAICKPLHYGSLLGSRACATMAAAAWGSGFLNAVLHTAYTFSLPLCQGNAVEQFFCEIPQILKLSCSDAYLREVGALMFTVFLAVGCFLFIVFKYVQIFRAVQRMPSEQGRHKAFSTCLPHLAVVSLFLSTIIFAYLKPPFLSFPSLHLVVSFLYSVLPPAVNPVLYSMRNKVLKNSVWKFFEYMLLQNQ
ncbi:olfactory receptor 14A16-like [Anas platyrhynchos]|uniref:olfactory receptor 14A16-like n=1 Tax=Anas platyrhynchos TaxID=8839 RepID=UPI003AF2FD0B